jgi:hypothetical protein
MYSAPYSFLLLSVPPILTDPAGAANQGGR